MSTIVYEMSDAELRLVDEAMSNHLDALAAFTLDVLSTEAFAAGLNGDVEKSEALYAIYDRMEVAQLAEGIERARDVLQQESLLIQEELIELEAELHARAAELGL